MCRCVYFSTRMLQINEDHITALTKNEDVCSHTKDLTDVYTKVEANISKREERVRKRKLAQGDDDRLVVGDKVLRRNIREEQRKRGKLEADLLGPYIVTNMEGKSAHLNSHKGTNVGKINKNIYVEPEDRIPSKWFATTSTSPPALQPGPSRSPSIHISPQSDTLTSSLQS